MEEFIDRVESFITKKTNPEGYRFQVKQGAQIELIKEFGGDDKAGTWIDAYSAMFEELLASNPILLEKLGDTDKGIHEEALEKIKKELYH